MTNFQEIQGEKEHDNTQMKSAESRLRKTVHSNKIKIKFLRKRKKKEMKGELVG